MNPIGEATVLAGEETIASGNCIYEKIVESAHSAAPPLFRGRPERYCEKTASVNLDASSDLCQRLSQVTKDEPFLCYAALAAALNICLFRYSRNSPIAIGAPVIRQENGAVNSDKVMVLVCDIDGAITFRQFLLNVRQGLLNLREKSYRVSDLFADGCRQRNRCPLFDVGLVIAGFHCEFPEVRNDVTLTFRYAPGKSSLEAAFSPELYDRETIDRFCGHVLRILQSGLENTSALISELAILTDQERYELVVEFNRTARDYSRQKCIHELFEEHVARFPNKTALVCGKQRFTYKEVNDRANQLAHYLNHFGISSDAPVGLFLNRSIEQVIGVLGILKAGAAYVPYDPGYPRDRLAAMFEDLPLKAVVTSERLANRLPAEVERIYVDGEADRIARESTEKLQVHPDARHLCYIIFTSGSTGRAKAAAVYHGGWINLLSWFVSEFQISPADKTLVMSSISFDITQRAMAMPLVSGGELHLVASDHYEPELILGTIEKEAITVVNCAPSTFYPLVEGANPSSRWEQLRSLRCLFLGGESISASRLNNWANRPKCKVRIGNVYGAAECSDVSSFYVLRDFSRYMESSVPIGKAIDNTQIYILDDNLQLVPRGVAGEICLAGDGVGKGYINDAALTTRKFPGNPFGTQPGELLYRTGDVGRYLPDGNLEFVGRVDHQVKIRGQRVELGEIETILRQHANVREAVVLQTQFSPDFQRLVAYVVPQEAIPQQADDSFTNDLHSTLTSKLPQYMVPNAFVILKEMPLNPNGKIDRGALPAPGIIHGGAIIAHPVTETEKSVAALFSKVLGTEQIGVNDNFFNLGGHSLLVTQVLAGVGEAFKTTFPAVEFYKEPTIAGIAKRLEQGADGAQV